MLQVVVCYRDQFPDRNHETFDEKLYRSPAVILSVSSPYFWNALSNQSEVAVVVRRIIR
jgi:hypothetical protein